jgi:urate oxidase
MKVTRHAHGHDLREWTVQVLLKGDFDTAHSKATTARSCQPTR